MVYTVEDVQDFLNVSASTENLVEKIRRSPATPLILDALRQQAPELAPIPQTSYTLYREFEHIGWRDGYERVFFQKRAMLTRAVFELLMIEPGSNPEAETALRDALHNLLWNICEETTWVLPAHEEQGPNYWELEPPIDRTWSLGTHTALTREPDAIDLFAAETGAALAEAITWVGDRLAPEVVQRVRQEVERHIFKPYLAYGRSHWWFKGPLNWNGVCNGSIGLTFMRLERDPRVLAEAIAMVLEGFEAYLATGFEPDGGSIEGIGYWNYGLMYFVTLAELLRERSGGKLDLLADPRLVKIARYPLAVALRSGAFVAFGDATEDVALEPGIVTRLAERTGVSDLIGLLVPADRREGRGVVAAKLAINLRDAAWWDGTMAPFPASAFEDVYLPDCAVVKFTGQTSTGQQVILAAKAGHNDGHHSHTDVGSFLYNIGGENLLVDPGKGHYTREYFRKPRYKNLFNNSLGHNLPVIGGKLQAAGPEFFGRQQYRGEIVAQGMQNGCKQVTIDFHEAYAIPELTSARRTLSLDPHSGELVLTDQFTFAGPARDIEEGLVTWLPVRVEGNRAVVQGEAAALEIVVEEPQGASLMVSGHLSECQDNLLKGELRRLIIRLPDGATRATLRMKPL